ncbi:MAG: oligosaccharide flippase family protein, partial [Candidatus Moranbacteria bacterium]|nr:oligosaccharide flippase family protein [Candidatus Moranbacteria bacterium]
MISLIKLKLISIAEIAHLRIFGHEMGEEMRKFLGHLSWSFFGGMIAAGMLLILNILAGRWLGPVEYGKYGLVVAISAIFIIPMTLGIDTAITYFVSKSKTAFEKKEIVASSLWLVGLFIAAVVLIASFFSEFLAGIFNAQKEIIEVAIFFSIFLAMRNILDAVIKGLHLFKFQSIIRIAEALIVIVSFYIFFETYGRFGFRSYVFAILAGYVFTISAI